MDWVERQAFPYQAVNRELQTLRRSGFVSPSDPPVAIPVSDGVTVTAIHIPGVRNHWIIYSPGNAAPMATSPMHGLAAATGMHVVQWDYPGYDRSTGLPTAANCVESLLRVFRWVRGRTSDPITLVGWSIGSGVTAQAAASLGAEVHSVVLVSAFMSIASIFVPGGLPFGLDHLRTKDVVARIPCQVLFIHGTADRMIPCYHSRYLWEKRYAGAAAVTPAVMLKGCGHVVPVASLAAAIKEFLPDAAPRAPRSSAHAALTPYRNRRLVVAGTAALAAVGAASTAYWIVQKRRRGSRGR